MSVTPVLPGDMEGLRWVSIDAKLATHPLFVIVKPRKRDSDQEGSFVAKAVKEDVMDRDVRAQLGAVIG